MGENRLMRQKWIIAVILISFGPATANAQQTIRPTAVLDAGAIRKQAAQLSEVRSLLADPDPNVRLLAIREIAKSGDPIQRQLAIDAGLSSAETSMQEVALRAVVQDTQQITILLSSPDGSAVKEGDTNVNLHVDKFEFETGKISGNSWSGQIQGAVFSFSVCCSRPGSLVWNSETGEFVGTVNVNGSAANGIRKAVWRPR